MSSSTEYDALIIGAGPGGLSCAAAAARAGLRVAVLERGAIPGRKVCAGGITGNGLLNRLPAALLEKSFCRQIIATPRRHVRIEADQPLIATVDRQRLGAYHAAQAETAGAEIMFGARALRIAGNHVVYRSNGREKRLSGRFLVGADGSHSLVREHLRVPTERIGIGITYYLDRDSDEMVWNFDSRRFGCGYTWLFPHRDRLCVGAYSGHRHLSPRLLQKQLLTWLAETGLDIGRAELRADLVNHDFRGWRFGSCFLVGDAAGLASPLTGEGIFPAVASGEAVAAVMAGDESAGTELQRMMAKHRKHHIMLRLARLHPLVASCLVEAAAVLLQRGILTAASFEMA